MKIPQITGVGGCRDERLMRYVEFTLSRHVSEEEFIDIAMAYASVTGSMGRLLRVHGLCIGVTYHANESFGDVRRLLSSALSAGIGNKHLPTTVNLDGP